MLASRNSTQFEVRAFVRRGLTELSTLEVPDLDPPFVVRFPVPASNLLLWLKSKETSPGFYFQSRDQSWELAGLGRYPAQNALSISLSQWNILQRLHPSAEHLRLFFTRNFSSNETWSEFSLMQNVLPLVCRERIGDAYFETHLIPSSLCQSEEEVTALVQKLLKESEQQSQTVAFSKVPELGARTDLPAKDGWRSNIETALSAIEVGNLEKVVLARQTDFKLLNKLDPLSLLNCLQNVQQRVYHFLYMPKADQVFLGASPERLFQVQNGQIKTEALAGTVPRQKKKDESLFSKKILHEHSCVIHGIKSRLQQIATSVVSDAEPAPVGLADVIHLRTRLRASLRQHTTIDEVLNCLHPTAAVCGEPQSEAASLIEELEPFKRGLYAGPVGVARGKDAECAVALRSCLAQANRLSFFAGAGIVAGSNPDSEWQELETKIATLLKLFA